MFKHILARIGALLLLGAVCASAILYYQGYFDLSFIDRTAVLGDGANTDASDPSDEQEPSAVDDPDDSGEQNMNSVYNEELMAQETGNVSHVGTPTDTTAADSEPPAPSPSEPEPLFRSVAEYAASGYHLTDAVYNADSHVLAVLTPETQLTTTYSFGQKTVAVPVRTYPSPDSEYVVVYENKSTARPAVELYMGYLLYDRGDGMYLLDAAGRTLMPLQLEQIRPAYTRDKNDNPVFVSETADEEGRITRSYWIVADDGKSFVAADYNDAADNRGLYYDYPSYFGKAEPDAPVLTYSDAYNTRSYSNTWSRYKYAFQYSEGLACVAGSNDEVTILNEYGAQAYPTWAHVRNQVNRNVHEIVFCTMPETLGEESIGFLYYEYGLMRLREQRVEYNSYYRTNRTVLYDIDRLVRTDGTDFPLPSGYTVVAYSDGIITLQKNGKYGYMDYTGTWIAQPIYAYASTFSEGLGILGLTNGKKGMIDREGNLVIPFQYDHLSNPSGGVIAAYTETSGWTIYQKLVKP